MSADSGLCTLTHFYLYRRAGVEVFLMHAETPRGNLNDCVFAVAVKVLVQSALAGVVKYAELFCRPCKAFVGVIAY